MEVMYQKVLVPLDGSIKEVGAVLDIARGLIDSDGEGVLLHVIRPGENSVVGLNLKTGAQIDKENRSRAMGYLTYFADSLNRSSNQWRGEVVVSKSVADGVIDFADLERVDVIAMYTHERKGLAKVLKGSVTEQILARAKADVRVVRPKGLEPQGVDSK